jgi:hypothetical protein
MCANIFRAVGRSLAVLGLALSILSTPTFAPIAQGANTACAPTSSKSNGADRIYTFTGATVCDWTIPAGWTSFTAEIVGGGGGGGGGSWAGTTGGGGGGGAPGSKRVALVSATAGNTVTISIGAGGSAGSGAASQGSTTGNNGGAGGLSSFTFSASDSFTANGGGGGFGASSDTGGAGGFGGGLKIGTSTYSEANGGSQNSGNGGEGKVQTPGTSASATSSYPGWSYIATGYANRFDLKGGGGGARTGTNLDAGTTTGTSSGGSSTNTAQAGKSNTGSGGGGGAGCSGASATCANRSGGAGASGYIMIYRDFGLFLLNQERTSSNPALNTSSMAVGIAPTFPTIFAAGPLGSVTYSVSPSLPAGLSLNTSTGVLSGVPTAATPNAFYRFLATDSDGTSATISWPLIINKGTGTTPTFSDGNLVFGVPTALTASGGTGTGDLTFSTSSTDCVLSGTRGETVTAQKSSGTCTIVVQKAGDANWYSASKAAGFTMTKRASSLSISVSPSSPREAGTSITISATVGSGQTGTVTFNANSSPITSCGVSGAVTISGTSATCTWIPSATGSPFTLTASYGGDTNYQNVSSNSLSYTIYPSIALSYPGISTTFGTAKSSTPSISGGTGSTSSWSWAIAKASDASAVTGISINSSGVVTAATSTATGTYSMQVTVTDTVGVTKSALVNVVVGLSSAANSSITSSVSSTTSGAVIRLTATVLASATGTFAFKFGATTVSGCGSVAISSGSATCDWTTPSAAGSPYSVTAVYSGDANFATSTTSALAITILSPGTFTYTSQNIVFGDGATVTPSISGGSGNFTSWTVVKVSDSSTVFGISINASGVVTVAQNLAAGTYNMRIAASDSNGVSGSGSLQIVITQATSTTITLSVRTITGTSLTGATLGRQVRLYVALSNPLLGSITFSDARGTLCTAFASSFSAECWWGPGDATYSPYSITASFAGNSNAAAATSNTITNFIWNPAMSVTHANRSVETGKTAAITPTVSGGTGAASTWGWGISQNLTGAAIGGITIDSSGVIRVSGSGAPGTYSMVVQSADLAGAYFYNYVTITISDIVAPSITISSSSESATTGNPITGFTITNSGSDIDSFSIDGSLPAGVVFDSGTGQISGTPSETVTALVITLTASNFAGSDTETYTLTITAGAGGSATITLALTGGAVVASKGTAVNIIATINVAGKVKFMANGKVITGCAAKSATTSATCSWKPSIQGQSVALTAILNPTSGSFSNVRSSALNVGVSRRSGRR